MDAADVAATDDNIKVFVRIRPPSARESELGETHARAVTIDTTDNAILLTTGAKTEAFHFDERCIGDESASQDQIFRTVGKVISDNCLQGYNGTIFAYGQTGSGKTYTMQGPTDATTGKVSFEERGIIPRCFEYLFGMIAREEKRTGGCVQYLCRGSFCEIYNEVIYDLMDPAAPAALIREDLKRGVYVDGLTEEAIASPEDAYRILEVGAKNRHVASTSMNRESSRSHSVFTLTIQSKVTDGDITDVRESRFNLVDLAGSERQKLAATSGIRLKEAGNINKSLLALGNVINALVDLANGKNRHVHYRDSKLTFLLRDSLGGNAKTFIVANASPSHVCCAETLSTLRFASRAKMIRNRAVVNQEFQGNVLQMQEEIKRLKHELILSKTHSASSLTLHSVDDEYLRDLGQGGGLKHCRALLIACMRGKKSVDERCDSLQQQVEALSTLVEEQKRSAQHDKMIIKFRESMVDLLRRKVAGPPLVSAELKYLREENLKLKHQVDSNPELARFAAENLRLRQQLLHFEQYKTEMQQHEHVQQAHSRLEKALSGQVLQLQSDLDLINEEKFAYAAAPESQQLQRQPESEQEIKELRAELSASVQTIAELEQTIERINLSRDLEVKRLRESSNIGDSSVVLVDAASAEEFQHSMDVLKDENSRLRVRFANLERKSRRISDFALENRSMSSDQLNDASLRLARLTSENDNFSAKCSELETELLSVKDELSTAKKTLEAVRQNHDNEKYMLESDLVLLENKLSAKELALDTLTEEAQRRSDELDDAAAALEVSRQNEIHMAASLSERVEECKKLEASQQASMAKNQQLEEEVARLSLLLAGVGQSQEELVQTTHALRRETEKLGCAEASIVTLSVKVEAANLEIEALTGQLHSERNNLSELHASYSRERAELLLSQRQCEELREQVQVLSQELESVRTLASENEAVELSRYAKLEKEKESKIAELTKNYEEETASMTARISSLQAQIDDYTTRTANLSVSVTSHEAKLTQLEEDLEAAVENSQSQQRTITRLKDEIAYKDSVVESYAGSAEHAADLKRELTSRSRRIEELEELESRLELLNAEHELSRKEKQRELTRQADEIAALKTYQESLLESVRNLEQKLAFQHDSFETLNRELESQVDTLKREVEAARRKAHSCELEYQSVDACLQVAQEDNQMLLDQIQSLEASLSNTSELQRELDRYRAELEAFRKVGTVEFVNGLRQQIIDISSTLEEKEELLNRDSTRLQALSDRLCQLDVLQGKNKSLEQQFDFMLKRNADLEQENAKLVQHNNFKQKLQYHLQIKQENNTLRAENQKLSMELERNRKGANVSGAAAADGPPTRPRRDFKPASH